MAAKVSPCKAIAESCRDKVTPCAESDENNDDVAEASDVVETSPLADESEEPSPKVKPPSPSASERMSAPSPTESHGVQTDEVAINEEAETLWYNDR